MDWVSFEDCWKKTALEKKSVVQANFVGLLVYGEKYAF